MKLQTISLRRSEQLNEKWVQGQIADDPSILGLGDLILKDKERPESRAGPNLSPYQIDITPQLGLAESWQRISTTGIVRHSKAYNNAWS
jgi:hypothetical protein